MEKTSSMDMDEWEYISDDGDEFLDIQLSRKMGIDQKCVLDVNYFICPSPTPSRYIFAPPPNSTVPIPRRDSKKLVPIPIQLEPVTGNKNPDHEFVKGISEVTVTRTADQIIAPTPEASVVAGDQDMITQVFFKKMKENEFVDMKMDSPNSGNPNIKAQPELGTFKFEETETDFKAEAKERNKNSSRVAPEQGMVKKDNPDSKSDGESDWGGGFCIWKWRISGFGALCSVGFAAATICIFIFGGHQKNRHQLNQNQKLHFQVYSDDKRIKEMVNHATRLNHVLSAVRNAPLTRANISFGGYYDGL